MGKKVKENPDLVACNGSIYFHAGEARDLKGGKKITPFCKVFLDKKKHFQSAVMEKTQDPSWDEQARLIVLKEEEPSASLSFVIFTKGTLMTDYIGEISFLTKDLMDGVPRNDWFVLKNKKGTKEVGEIHLQVMYLKQGEDMTDNNDEFPYPLQTLLRKGNLDSWANLIKTDPDMDLKDVKGKTALHICAELNLVEELNVLLEKNADITITDNTDQTPLHTACIFGSKEVAEILVSKGSDVKAKDEEEKTPLHLACAKDHKEIAELLLSKEAAVSAPDKNGDTPLHIAIQLGSKKCVPFLVEKEADIFVENKQAVDCCNLSVEVGKENEGIKKIFFEAIQVVDAREFDLKKKHSHRAIAGSKCLSGEDAWEEENLQMAVTGEKGAEIFLIMHYNDPMSKNTQPMEKNSFLAFLSQQSEHKEISYWHENICYGRVEPISLTIMEEDTSYILIPFSKSLTKLSGAWNIVGYSDSEFKITEVKPWEHRYSLENKWDEETAGGCIEHDSFVNNPRYLLQLPPQKVTLSVSLRQQKNLGDIEPFSIVPYKYHIGAYFYPANLTTPVQIHPIVQTKFKNSRETNGVFHLDGNEHSSLLLIPSTFRPGETADFTLCIGSDAELKIEEAPEIPKAEDSPKKKKKKKSSKA